MVPPKKGGDIVEFAAWITRCGIRACTYQYDRCSMNGFQSVLPLQLFPHKPWMDQPSIDPILGLYICANRINPPGVSTRHESVEFASGVHDTGACESSASGGGGVSAFPDIR